MKSIIKAFPYPVLGRGDDYLNSEFQTTIDVRKDASPETNNIFLEYSFLLSSDSLTDLIAENKVSYAIDVACTDTLYRRVFLVGQSGAIEFRDGELYGKVLISPLIVAKTEIKNYFSEDLNEEFGDDPFAISPGDILAYDDPQVKYIEFNKLQFESLVRVETSLEIPEETYRFSLEEDMITIYMGKKFRHIWDVCREEKDKAPMLAMSVYKDCIQAALDFMIHNEDSESLKWVRALRLKLNSLGKVISPESDFNDLCIHAQQLVSKYGVQRMLRNVE